MSYQLTPSKYLNEAEVEELERAFDTSTNSILIEMGLKCGGRASEILNIRKSDLDVYHRSVFIRGLKGSDDRTVFLPTDLFGRLLLHSKRTAGELLFPYSYDKFRDAWMRFRPSGKKLHCLRHTFALRVYNTTKDINLVKYLLGHRNLNNTMIYLNYSYSVSEQKNYLERMYGNAKGKTQTS